MSLNNKTKARKKIESCLTKCKSVAYAISVRYNFLFCSQKRFLNQDRNEWSTLDRLFFHRLNSFQLMRFAKRKGTGK